MRWNSKVNTSCNSESGASWRRKAADEGCSGEKWETRVRFLRKRELAAMGGMLGKKNPICQGDENDGLKQAFIFWTLTLPLNCAVWHKSRWMERNVCIFHSSLNWCHLFPLKKLSESFEEKKTDQTLGFLMLLQRPVDEHRSGRTATLKNLNLILLFGCHVEILSCLSAAWAVQSL